MSQTVLSHQSRVVRRRQLLQHRNSAVLPVCSFSIRYQHFSINVSTASFFTMLTVHPPNPPPVIREPITPGTSHASSTRYIDFFAGYFVIIAQRYVGFVHQFTKFFNDCLLSMQRLHGWFAGFRIQHVLHGAVLQDL